MKISSTLVKYLEKSQGVKFKIIPTLHKTTKEHSYSKVVEDILEYRNEKTNKIFKTKKELKSADIYIQDFLFKEGKEKRRDLVILHEAREILIGQYDKRNRNLTLREKSQIHFKSQSYENKDKQFLDKLYKYKGYTDTGIKFTKKEYIKELGKF